MEENRRQTCASIGHSYQGTKETFSDFCSKSSAPGLNKIVQPQSSYVKVFWYVAVLATALCLLSHLGIIIDSYFRYEKIQQGEIKYEVPRYPHITVCNNEPYSEEGRKAADSKMRDFSQYRRNLANLNMEKNVNKILFKVSTVAAEVANLGLESAMESGHEVKNIVVHCILVSKKCKDISTDTRLVKALLNPFFLNCFTIKGSVLEKVNPQTGLLGSLSLILHSEYSDLKHKLYNKGVTENQIGMRIIIHEQETLYCY